MYLSIKPLGSFPKKKPRGGHLTLPDCDRNLCVSIDKVIVKNLFCCSSSKFGILSGKYRWNRERFDTIMDLCFNLTNYHIHLNPLREEDKACYRCVLAGLRKRTKNSANEGRKSTCFRKSAPQRSYKNYMLMPINNFYLQNRWKRLFLLMTQNQIRIQIQIDKDKDIWIVQDPPPFNAITLVQWLFALHIHFLGMMLQSVWILVAHK